MTAPLATCVQCWHVHTPDEACVLAECERAGDYDSDVIDCDEFLLVQGEPIKKPSGNRWRIWSWIEPAEPSNTKITFQEMKALVEMDRGVREMVRKCTTPP